MIRIHTTPASRRLALIGAVALAALSALGACSSVTGPNCGFRPRMAAGQAAEGRINSAAPDISCVSTSSTR